VEDVGDDGAVGGGEGKSSKEGVGGKDGGTGSAWVPCVKQGTECGERCQTYLVAVGKCESKSGTISRRETPRVHLANETVKRVFDVGTALWCWVRRLRIGQRERRGEQRRFIGMSGPRVTITVGITPRRGRRGSNEIKVVREQF